MARSVQVMALVALIVVSCSLASARMLPDESAAVVVNSQQKFKQGLPSFALPPKASHPQPKLPKLPTLPSLPGCSPSCLPVYSPPASPVYSSPPYSPPHRQVPLPVATRQSITARGRGLEIEGGKSMVSSTAK